MALTAEQQSAKAIVDATLAQYGLGGLGAFAWSLYLAGAPVEQVMLEIRNRPEYATRFAGMAALAAKGRALSEQAYIEYERSAASLFRAYGMPVGFYDQPDDFARYIGGEVSLKELEDRLKIGQTAAFSGPLETRTKLQELYGISGGALTAYWLDPDRAMAVLTQQYTAASLAGEGLRQGLTVGRTQAERLATLGVSDEQARQGFGQVAAAQELGMTLPGEAATQVGAEDLVDTAFGLDAAATERVRRQAEKRKSAFAGAGSYASSQQGITGLGAADQLG
jgi:hypothetical protein